MANKYCIDCGCFEMAGLNTRCTRTGEVISPLLKRSCWSEKTLEDEVPLPPLDYSKMGHRVWRTDSHHIIVKPKKPRTTK